MPESHVLIPCKVKYGTEIWTPATEEPLEWAQPGSPCFCPGRSFRELFSRPDPQREHCKAIKFKKKKSQQETLFLKLFMCLFILPPESHWCCSCAHGHGVIHPGHGQTFQWPYSWKKWLPFEREWESGGTGEGLKGGRGRGEMMVNY